MAVREEPHQAVGDQEGEAHIGPTSAGVAGAQVGWGHSPCLDFLGQAMQGGHIPPAEVESLPAHRMARHGVVKSNQVIMDFPKLTIWDSLLLAVAEHRYEQPHRVLSEGTVFRRHRDEIRHHLDYFGFADPTAFALSAGEKKLLDIVRCLLLRPRFLLLDEPAAGLPDELTEKVMTVVRELAAAGTSVVVVEHDLNVIWGLCDEVLFMAEGKVVLRGDPQSIRENRTVVEKYLGEGHV